MKNDVTKSVDQVAEQVVDGTEGAIAGALHGNVAQMVKGVAKNVGEMELNNEAQKILAPVADKLMPQSGGTGNVQTASNNTLANDQN